VALLVASYSPLISRSPTCGRPFLPRFEPRRKNRRLEPSQLDRSCGANRFWRVGKRGHPESEIGLDSLGEERDVCDDGAPKERMQKEESYENFGINGGNNR
jgi:hypothetical protein